MTFRNIIHRRRPEEAQRIFGHNAKTPLDHTPVPRRMAFLECSRSRIPDESPYAEEKVGELGRKRKWGKLVLAASHPRTGEGAAKLAVGFLVGNYKWDCLVLVAKRASYAVGRLAVEGLADRGEIGRLKEIVLSRGTPAENEKHGQTPEKTRMGAYIRLRRMGADAVCCQIHGELLGRGDSLFAFVDRDLSVSTGPASRYL